MTFGRRCSMNDSMTKENGVPVRERWEDFCRFLFYRPIEYDDLPAHVRLADYLQEIDRKYRTGGNRIFYLASPLRNDGTDAWASISFGERHGKDTVRNIPMFRFANAVFEPTRNRRYTSTICKSGQPRRGALALPGGKSGPRWDEENHENQSGFMTMNRI